MGCKKLKHRLNAYIYGKCGINKDIVTLANSLNTIKCGHFTCVSGCVRKK